jgi:putative phage-type endonuclease
MITPEQRELRRQYIGSSDAPAIVGVDPYRTAYDVWAEKRGLVAGFAGNAWTEAGTYCEDAILDWLAMKLDRTISRDISLVDADGVLAANLDGMVLDDARPALVEAKLVGIASGVPGDEWGDPQAGVEGVPKGVLIQTHHAIAVSREQADLPKLTRIIVPALIVTRGFVRYEFEVNEALVDAVRQAGREFYKHYVQAGVAPPESIPSTDTIKRMMRAPNKVVPVDTALVANWLKTKAEAARASEQAEAVRDAMLASLGDAEAGECELGRIEYQEQSRKEYTVPASTYRVLRFKKPKAGVPAITHHKE